jgi:hypothetical protein
MAAALSVLIAEGRVVSPVTAEHVEACPKTRRLLPAQRVPPILAVALRGVVAGLFLAAAGEAVQVFIARNVHEVVPGRVYRCAQPSATALEAMIRRYGIHTVLNLRGCCDPAQWYLEECRATHERQVCQEDICMSAGRLPDAPEMRHLVEVLDHIEYPILLHCWRGADRTGLVSAIILLLEDGVDFASARRQLSLRYGHLALGRPAYLDKFFDLYAAWLTENGQAHTPDSFRRWVADDYVPTACRCEIQALEVPTRIPHDQPTALRVRFRNTSNNAWSFRPGTNAGIHAVFDLRDIKGLSVASGRAGLYDTDVPPGEAIDLTLALPAIRKPGHYQLFVDLNDEAQCWFFQVGSEPWEREVEVY